MRGRVADTIRIGKHMKAWKAVSLTLAVVALVGLMCAVLLIHRGFRATNQPSRLETIVAHTARNLSIPSAARGEKNPLETSQKALQAGRDAFLARCQTC